MRILCVFGQHNYGNPSRGEGYEFANFLPALRALGHEVALFESWNRSAYGSFAELNRAFLSRVESYQPDLVFSVLMSYELWMETLDLVRHNSSIAFVNWGTDDSWKYKQFTRVVARHVDLHVTTSHRALAHARIDGLDNLWLSQWAANSQQLNEPLPAAACNYSVSFVGSAYGNRRKWIRDLAARGIEVDCFGHGWPRGPVAAEDIPRILRASIVSLNFGDSGMHLKGVIPYRSRQIKARVFEVPGAGGLLATEPGEYLQDYYRPDVEIVTFRDIDELASRIRHLLAHPKERDSIARAGHERTRREHTYARRFCALFDRVAAIRRANPPMPFRFDDAAWRAIAARHQGGAGCTVLRSALVAPSVALFGARRGPRAARRLLFELSWRISAKRTYSASGLPGRLFYDES